MCVASLSRKYWHTRLRGLGGGAIGCWLDAPISHCIGRFREILDGMLRALERRAELDGRQAASHRRDRARSVNLSGCLRRESELSMLKHLLSGWIGALLLAVCQPVRLASSHGGSGNSFELSGYSSATTHSV